MLNKPAVIGIVAVVVLGGGYLAYSNLGGSSSSEKSLYAPATDTESASTPAEGKKMSIESYIKQGGTHVCTVTQNAGGIESKGTLYIAGEKIGGEFSSVVQGMDINTYLIVKDGYSYVWTSLMPNVGFKSVTVMKDSNSGASTETSGSYGWDASKIGDYDCKPWTLNASKFVLPSSVTFGEARK